MAERKPFLLRIDPALWAELEAWAQADLRSVNGQIEYLLKQALQKRKTQSPGLPAEAPIPSGRRGRAEAYLFCRGARGGTAETRRAQRRKKSGAPPSRSPFRDESSGGWSWPISAAFASLRFSEASSNCKVTAKAGGSLCAPCGQTVMPRRGPGDTLVCIRCGSQNPLYSQGFHRTFCIQSAFRCLCPVIAAHTAEIGARRGLTGSGSDR